MLTQPAKDIIRELEHITATGCRPSDIFDDWLALTHACLETLPAQARSVTQSGVLAEDTPEVQALFARLRDRYINHKWVWGHFQKALMILLDTADPRIGYEDTLGLVYMEWGTPNKNNGQFFTPMSVARLMAKNLEIGNTVYDRIQEAYEQTLTGKMHRAICGEQADERIPAFVRRMGVNTLPMVAGTVLPVRISDPSCGSGVMFLAAAESVERWMLDWGLIQFYGCDIDMTCVQMCQVNMMLYGLNGYSIKLALALEGAGSPEAPASAEAPEDAYTVDVSAWKQEVLL